MFLVSCLDWYFLLASDIYKLNIIFRFFAYKIYSIEAIAVNKHFQFYA